MIKTINSSDKYTILFLEINKQTKQLHTPYFLFKYNFFCTQIVSLLFDCRFSKCI